MAGLYRVHGLPLIGAGGLLGECARLLGLGRGFPDQFGFFGFGGLGVRVRNECELCGWGKVGSLGENRKIVLSVTKIVDIIDYAYEMV